MTKPAHRRGASQDFLPRPIQTDNALRVYKSTIPSKQNLTQGEAGQPKASLRHRDRIETAIARLSRANGQMGLSNRPERGPSALYSRRISVKPPISTEYEIDSAARDLELVAFHVCINRANYKAFLLNALKRQHGDQGPNRWTRQVLVIEDIPLGVPVWDETSHQTQQAFLTTIHAKRRTGEPR